MSMRRIIAATAVAVVAAVPPAHAADDARGCRLSGSRTVREDTHVRIYKRSGNLYGCLFSAARRVKLGEYSAGPTARAGQRNLRVTGRFVAFEDYAVGKGVARYEVEVFDLRRAQRVQERATGHTPPGTGAQGFVEGLGPTTDLVLRRTGAVAWIAKDAYTGSPRFEVHRSDANGPRLLASGEAIESSSLKLHDARISWRENGRSRTAGLE